MTPRRHGRRHRGHDRRDRGPGRRGAARRGGGGDDRWDHGPGRWSAARGGEETTGGGLDEAAEAAGGADDAEVVDELPEDLDAAGFVGPYLFPNNNRRRVPGYLYLVVAAVCVAVWALVDDSSYVNDGFLLAAGLLAVVGRTSS